MNGKSQNNNSSATPRVVDLTKMSGKDIIRNLRHQLQQQRDSPKTDNSYDLSSKRNELESDGSNSNFTTVVQMRTINEEDNANDSEYLEMMNAAAFLELSSMTNVTPNRTNVTETDTDLTADNYDDLDYVQGSEEPSEDFSGVDSKESEMTTTGNVYLSENDTY